MIDKMASEVLGPEVDYACYKEKHNVIFILFIYHKNKCCMVKVTNVLSHIWIPSKIKKQLEVIKVSCSGTSSFKTFPRNLAFALKLLP